MEEHESARRGGDGRGSRVGGVVRAEREGGGRGGVQGKGDITTTKLRSQ